MSRINSGSFNLRILTAYAGWWLLWIGIQSLVIRNLGFSWEVALLDAAGTQVALSLSGYIINTTLRFYQPRKIIAYIFTWSIAMTLISVLLQRWALQRFLSDNLTYLAFLENSLFIRGAFDWLMIAFITLTSWLWFYVLDQQENEKQRELAERLAREAELSNLRMQLQPHFLFNSLNSISALIGSRPDQARTMIQQLSDFLRGTLRKDNRQSVSLDEELSHLQLYLEIEKVRFGHRLTTTMEIGDRCLAAEVPLLLLQPIVENAIKFGLYDTVGEITITVTAHMDDNYLIIEIKNPFDPSTSHPRKGTGFGLDSIRRRLYLIYSQNDLLATRQEGEVFATLLKIPQPT